MAIYVFLDLIKRIEQLETNLLQQFAQQSIKLTELKKYQMQQESHEAAEIMPTFPLNTVGEVLNLEELVADSSRLKKSLVRF